MGAGQLELGCAYCRGLEFAFLLESLGPGVSTILPK